MRSDASELARPLRVAEELMDRIEPDRKRRFVFRLDETSKWQTALTNG